MATREQSSLHQRPLPVALAGMLSLGVAVGFGRFGFTPLMPMMLHDGLLNLTQASWLASANYIGYLVGAILCTLQPRIWAQRRWQPIKNAYLIRTGLLLTCVLTALMAIDVAAAWPWLRFFSGVASAIGFIYTSSWCLTQLTRMNAMSVGSLIYAGPGLGIIVSGLAASLMVMQGWHASSGWISFSVMAAAISAIIWTKFYGVDLPAQQAGSKTAELPTGGSLLEKIALTIAYGFSGFGYIITATYLPVIARAALPGSVMIDLFWPIVGVGIASGALMATRIKPHIDIRYVLGGCYLMQSIGVVLGIWFPSTTGFVIGSLLVGTPFTMITFFALQIGRRLHPQSSSGIISLLTVSFSVCQIAGPIVAAMLLEKASDPAQGFVWALNLAASTLVAGGVICLVMAKAYPQRS